MKPYLLRLHRWLTLVFGLPLVVIVVTGLILSFEPIATATSRVPGALDAARVEALLDRHDPEGKARGLAYRPYENALTLIGGPSIDVKTGERLAAPGALSSLFGQSRGLHEHLIYDMGWLVTASTIAMCVIAALGLLMGLPYRLTNSFSGWHKATAWFLSPLVILAPLTGLALVYGVTFAGEPGGGGARGAQPTLREAVKIVGAQRDLSNLIWLRQRGGRLLVRLEEAGEARVYAVAADGLRATPRNVPRLMHEGNWAGVWSGLINVVASIALMILMTTGLVIWARRRLRKPQRSRTRAAPTPA
ncbi:MAG: PepSY domain-containing protein [Methylobacteriaceae bacterium]|nr:PepSY domain-containing protein [Methylobacteriaceae bacterium]